jgi:hypothetical protein
MGIAAESHTVLLPVKIAIKLTNVPAIQPFASSKTSLFSHSARRIPKSSHRDQLQATITAKLHRDLWQVRKTTKPYCPYKVFEKKKRKIMILEVRVKMEKQHVRTGRMM